MKKVIILIVGDSGSGKTHMSKFLNEFFGVPYICSYTTRPIRPDEVDGVDHHFISTNHRFKRDEMIAYFNYSGYEYFSTIDQVKPLCSYVIDEQGAVEMITKYSDIFSFITVNVRRDIDNRLKSGVSRERIMRDRKRHRLDDDFYDCIIHNDGTLNEFNHKIKSLLYGRK